MVSETTDSGEQCLLAKSLGENLTERIHGKQGTHGLITSLSERCGISRSGIYSLMAGRYLPKVSNLVAICSYLDVSVTDMLGLVDPRKEQLKEENRMLMGLLCGVEKLAREFRDKEAHLYGVNPLPSARGLEERLIVDP